MLVKSMDDRFIVTGYTRPDAFLLELEGGQKFDLVICDLIMNAMNGLAFLTALRGKYRTLPVLMLSGINTQPPLAKLRRLKGNGFVHKSAEDEKLREAITTLLTGRTYFDDGLGDSLAMHDMPDMPIPDENIYMTKAAVPKLSPRQIEILRLIAAGSSNKAIATGLEISENTVKTHLKQIFQELGVNKRTACVRQAQTIGLI